MFKVLTAGRLFAEGGNNEVFDANFDCPLKRRPAPDVTNAEDCRGSKHATAVPKRIWRLGLIMKGIAIFLA